MIKIQVKGTDSLIRKLRAYKGGLAAKQHELMERLAAIGIDLADVGFHTAQYDGENDVVVDGFEWEDGNRLVLSAHGTTILFIEFGTGVHYTEVHPKAEEMGMERGSYGQGKGKQDSWGYYGDPGTNGKAVEKKNGDVVILTHGNPPNRAMYDAATQMRERVLEIAKEVFGR